MQKMLLEGTKERVEGTRNSKNNDWRKVAFLYYDHNVAPIFGATPYAGMAELADALDSGSSRGNSVEVQVLLPAPIRKRSGLPLLFCVDTGLGQRRSSAKCPRGTHFLFVGASCTLRNEGFMFSYKP